MVMCILPMWRGHPRVVLPWSCKGALSRAKALKHGLQGRSMSFHMRYKASMDPITPKITLEACLIHPKATAKIWGASGKVQI